MTFYGYSIVSGSTLTIHVGRDREDVEDSLYYSCDVDECSVIKFGTVEAEFAGRAAEKIAANEWESCERREME